MERYEKPELKFVALRNEENVADKCWGYHNSVGTTLYCDVAGDGWASFQIAEGNCNLNIINVKYHWDVDGNGKIDENESKPLSKDDPKYEEVIAALKNSGGNAGQPYKEADSDITTKPEPEWS